MKRLITILIAPMTWEELKITLVNTLMILMFAILLILLPAKKACADDTAGLQSLLNAGNVTLTRNYSISATETVTYLLHLNGFTVSTSQTTGVAFKMGSSGSAIDGGTIQGTWNYLTAGNPAGNAGISIAANHVTISNVTVTQFLSYGMVCGGGAYSNLTISGCNITKTGYIGFYFDPEIAGSSTNKFINNTVDRSMIDPATVQYPAVAIRGSTSSGITTTGWTITGNHFLMPHSPSASVSACLEVRYANNTKIANNTFDGGSIGASVLKGTNDTTAKNIFTNSKLEAIEYGGLITMKDSCNKITGSVNDGILLDGYPSASTNNSTLLNDTVSACGTGAIHAFFYTDHLTVKGCVLSTTTSGKVINLQLTNHITLINNSIDGGSHSGVAGVYFESCKGNLTNTDGSVTHCTYAIFAYSITTGAMTDSITFNHVSLTGTTNQKGSYFTNGAFYGPHIYFNAASMVFATLPAKTYGDADFSPGAVSTLPITYTSSNTAIASIISGNIHITGTGSVNITATNADTAITKPMTVSKAALAIFADPKIKQQGTVNPTLTATYAGFVYGQTNSVLMTQPTLATSAVTSSAPGSYAITNSGAAAANYTITNYGNYLTIYGGPVVFDIFKVQ